jgi:hypothetical protein
LHVDRAVAQILSKFGRPDIAGGGTNVLMFENFQTMWAQLEAVDNQADDE